MGPGHKMTSLAVHNDHVLSCALAARPAAAACAAESGQAFGAGHGGAGDEPGSVQPPGRTFGHVWFKVATIGCDGSVTGW